MMKQANGIIDSSSQDKSLSDFDILASIGKGTYGQMYKAIDRKKGDFKVCDRLKYRYCELNLFSDVHSLS